MTMKIYETLTYKILNLTPSLSVKSVKRIGGGAVRELYAGGTEKVKGKIRRDCLLLFILLIFLLNYRRRSREEPTSPPAHQPRRKYRS